MTGRQVMYRRRLQSGDTELLAATVLRENVDGTLLIKAPFQFRPFMIDNSAVVPGAKIYGTPFQDPARLGALPKKAYPDYGGALVNALMRQGEGYGQY
jgi:hypothetical protein